MKAIQIISNEISRLEAVRDFCNITEQDSELLIILNFCYDLLTRTKIVQEQTVIQPEEMKEPGFTDEFVQQFPSTSNPLADFVFCIETKQGEIDMRKLLRYALFPAPQYKIARQAGIRPNTISDYLNGHKSLSCDNYQKIIKAINEIQNQKK